MASSTITSGTIVGGAEKQNQVADASDVIDFGAATSLEIPNSAAPTVNAAGEIAIDTTITDYTGMIKYYDGTEELVTLAVPTAKLITDDFAVMQYNATNNELELINRNDTYFSVGRSAVQSIATGTFTKVELDNEISDAGGTFDSTTNYRHVPTIPGKYLYIGVSAIAHTAADKRVQGFITKNGSSAFASIAYAPVSGGLSTMMVTILDMNGSTDYVELYIQHNAGANRDTTTSISLVGFRI